MSTLIVKDKENDVVECINAIFSHTKKNFNIELWDGKIIHYSYEPKFVLKILDKNVFGELMSNPNIMGFAQAFIDKKIDVEGDIFEAIKLKDSIAHLELSNKEKISLFFKTASLPNINIHSKQRDRENIQHHYDISNEFYKLFLGDIMVYSCGYFKTENCDLNTAQQNKLDHICKKLMLKKGETLLDIGCGWGSMIIWAAKHYGVKATGITISEQQYKYAKQRIKAENLDNLCSVELKDYRDIKGNQIYDKIVSIGMFEHVGIKNLPEYFNIIYRLLKDDGLFLNHGITNKKEAKLSKNEAEFIEKYVFPGGELKNIGYILDIMENSKFDIFDVECLREHYYKTLKCWVKNLQSNKKQAITTTSEKTYRVWLLYMTGCALNFKEDHIAVYQALLGKERKRPGFIFPLTREYIYK